MANLLFKIIGVVLNYLLYIKSSSQSTGHFWHLTDLHWDKNYTDLGGNPSKMCWKSMTSGGNSTGHVGKFGNYACDSPWELVKSTLDFMRAEQPNADFIVWTGDDDSHVSDNYFSVPKVKDIMSVVSNAIQTAFPVTPLFPTFGNHDAYPKSTFSPQMGSQWYREVADLWKQILGDDAYHTFQLGGYYQRAHPTIPNVVIIALNTPVYYQNNKQARYKKDKDPIGQLTWLDKTLTNLAKESKKAYILAHISPGMFGRKVTPNGYPWFQNQYNNRYVDLLTKHSDTIYGQFYGHDHTDSFKLYYNSQGKAVNLHLVAPAVTPWNTTLSGIGPNNPGLRLVTYDLQTGKIVNYKQYYLNLTEANAINVANWKLEYDFLSAYNLPDMSCDSIDRLVQSFVGTDRTYFNKYYQYNSVSYTSSADNCDRKCVRNHYCAITRVKYSDFVQCNSPNSTHAYSEEDVDDVLLVNRQMVRGQQHQKIKRWTF